MFKNVASQKLTLLAIDTAANTPKTGDSANITAYVSKDDGSVTVLGDTSASELDATNAPGLYSFDLTQAETNADKLLFSAKSSTSGIRIVPKELYTIPASWTIPVVTLVNTLTTYTGNTVQTGDCFGSTQRQQMAREAFGVSGTVYHVATSGAGGNDGLSWVTAKVAPKTVIEAATANDLVKIGHGTFALAGTFVTSPSGVSIDGAGRDETIITFTGLGSAVAVGPNAKLTNLFVKGTTSGAGQFPVEVTGDNVLVQNVRTSADTDGVVGYTSGTKRFENCVFECKYNCFAITAGTYEVTRCDLRAIGPLSSAQQSFPFSVASTAILRARDCTIMAKNGGTTLTAGVVGQGTGDIYLWNCDISAEDSGANPVNGIQNFSTGKIVMIGGRIRTKNSNDTDKAINNVSTGTIVLIGVTYDRSKVTNSGGGTVVDLPPGTDILKISGDSTAADNAESFFDGTGYAGTNNIIPTVTTLTNLPAITADWLTATGLAASAVAEIQSGLSTVTTAEITALLAAATVTYVGPVTEGGDVDLKQTNSYNSIIGNALTWTFTGMPTIPADAVVTFIAKLGDNVFTVTGERLSSTSFKVEIDGAYTTAALVPAGTWKLDIDVTSATWGSGKKVTYVDRSMLVRAKVTA